MMRECMRLAVVGLAVVSVLYLLIRYLTVLRGLAVVPTTSLHTLKEEYTIWPPFNGKLRHTQEWYARQCFDGRSSQDLEEIFSSLIPTWSESLHPECQDAYSMFQQLYEVHHRTSGSMEIPSTFAKRVREWLGGDELYREKIDRQTVIHVYHPLMSEQVVYNPVRAQRPMQTQGQDIFEWVEERVKKTRNDCDFCKYNTQTAVDKFGRHESKDVVRISNTFKMEAHHSMVIPTLVHHPLQVPRDLLIHLFEETTQWFFDVSHNEPHYIYPNLAWDSLFHAGASQMHPHIQVLLAPDHYYGGMEGLRSAGQAYLRTTGRNYFNSLVTIYDTLGLAVEYGEAVALAMLSGKGELEVMFLCDYPSKDFFSLIYFVIQAYHDTFKQPCKSLGGAWPALGTSHNASLGRLPAVARMVSRGDCSSLRADVSSFEIFQAVYRMHTPWQVAAAIRKAIEKYDK